MTPVTILTEQNLAHLKEVLGAPNGQVLLNESDLRDKFAPEEVGFAVEAALESARGWVAVQQLYDSSAEELPAHVAATTHFEAEGPHLVLVAPNDPEDRTGGCNLCTNLIEAAAARGFGLALWVDGMVKLVLPPAYVAPPLPVSEVEHGHIPSWVLTSLEQLPGVSVYLRSCLTDFIATYRELVAHDGPDNQAETKVLMDFSYALLNGDRRLLFPFTRLSALQEFERAGGDPKSRDHFFHTFNDFFLGLIILAGLHENLTSLVHLIADPEGNEGFAGWEALWTLTAFFHDPGYLTEKLGAALVLATGVPFADGHLPKDLDEPTITRIWDMWGTVFLTARETLRLVLEKVGLQEIDTKFYRGLELAYCDGQTVGHSVMSGLTLITLCKTDTAAKKVEFNENMARAASGIAALSMVFHDPSARAKLCGCGVPPIPFEKLPYASALMFADCLQDDRRDITISTFPSEGILRSLTVDATAQLVIASVDLRSVPLKGLPWKIAEYESVLSWIGPSATKFEIEYRSAAGLKW